MSNNSLSNTTKAVSQIITVFKKLYLFITFTDPDYLSAQIRAALLIFGGRCNPGRRDELTNHLNAPHNQRSMSCARQC